ncbi:sugar transferase [Flagellimonas alvinocaridis]|uniref:Sugar transferase n=1 Tax=Flagellimonas alvinocaridis TaxID=2530200 RepID=A0A4S8RJF7_9FLAO|nr:sugar transferase [Allomuricauda alvinocaridis]THV58120.1 sugar transferase [Allomuricauda alvinocaridis]
MKRLFDIILSSFGILVLSPILVLIAILVKISSKGPVFFRQVRVGKGNKDFRIFKFRTMYTGSDKKGLLTVGGRDPRVTKVGYYLRKFKLDELPQLFNVFTGEMSLVGPRPEVRKYVEHYSESDMEVLSVRPGITDYASIAFRNENDILKESEDPEKKYIEEIMPIKLGLNKKYIAEKGMFKDLSIIFKTITVIIKKQ